MKRLGVGIRGAVARPQAAVRVPVRTSYLPLASRLDPAAPSALYRADRLLSALAFVSLRDGQPHIHAIGKNPDWARLP